MAKHVIEFKNAFKFAHHIGHQHCNWLRRSRRIVHGWQWRRYARILSRLQSASSQQPTPNLLARQVHDIIWNTCYRWGNRNMAFRERTRYDRLQGASWDWGVFFTPPCAPLAQRPRKYVVDRKCLPITCNLHEHKNDLKAWVFRCLRRGVLVYMQWLQL